MTHPVLARKWRPRDFAHVVGQPSAVRALSNALDTQRLHHAYLFTGTRGVGKTSIARLFVKCLNCQQGVSSKPCHTCDSCVAIDQGRFLDLLEVDAASRTKVEDTRDLLENVQYAPTQGRYKVYLIDEVHMLSNHSFNALLKTLEEPPAHVKFLLATTDPQRLPVTILSRCLQFHLKNLSAEQIAQQLAYILDEEQIAYEYSALSCLAQAAQGSMRDALSLLDQTIAYTNAQVLLQETQQLLGATAPLLLNALMHHLIEGNAKALLADIQSLAESGVDFTYVLDELLNLLHQIMIAQQVPDTAAHELNAFATMISAEALQLYYQIGLMGKRDIALSPTPRSGFEVTLLRMLAFRPQRLSIDAFLEKNLQKIASPNPQTKTATPSPTCQAPSGTANKPAMSTLTPTETVTSEHPVKAPVASTTTPFTQTASDEPLSWAALLPKLNLNGATQMLAAHCYLLEQSNMFVRLALVSSHAILQNKITETALRKALQVYYNQPELALQIDLVTESTHETPALLDKKRQEQRQCEAEHALAGDAGLNALISAFDAKVLPDSIRPIRN